MTSDPTRKQLVIVIAIHNCFSVPLLGLGMLYPTADFGQTCLSFQSTSSSFVLMFWCLILIIPSYLLFGVWIVLFFLSLLVYHEVIDVISHCDIGPYTVTFLMTVLYVP